jgi:hypothetical protein
MASEKYLELSSKLDDMGRLIAAIDEAIVARQAIDGDGPAKRKSIEIFIAAIKAGKSPDKAIVTAAIQSIEDALSTGRVPPKKHRGGERLGESGKQRLIAKTFYMHKLQGRSAAASLTADEWRCQESYVYKQASKYGLTAEADALSELMREDFSRWFPIAVEKLSGWASERLNTSTRRAVTDHDSDDLR